MASNGGTDDTMRVVERLTRVSDETIDYYFAIEDASRWVPPFSDEVPFVTVDGDLYDYG